jgi:hypothetical protein
VTYGCLQWRLYFTYWIWTQCDFILSCDIQLHRSHTGESGRTGRFQAGEQAHARALTMGKLKFRCMHAQLTVQLIRMNRIRSDRTFHLLQ